MTGAAARFELADKVDQRLGARDLAAGDGRADARQVLQHHAAGADIEMADFGIAHLAAGQADVLARGAQKAVRQVLPQPVEGRRLGLADGVIRRVLAPAPAVEHNKHHGAALLHSIRSRSVASRVLRIAARASIARAWNPCRGILTGWARMTTSTVELRCSTNQEAFQRAPEPALDEGGKPLATCHR